MFESVGNQTAKTVTDALTAALPGVEKIVPDAISGVQVLLTQTLLPVLADCISQLELQVNRLDGATVTLTPSGPLTVAVTIPTFTATVSMPIIVK